MQPSTQPRGIGDILQDLDGILNEVNAPDDLQHVTLKKKQGPRRFTAVAPGLSVSRRQHTHDAQH
jgi:hypothetical protein